MSEEKGTYLGETNPEQEHQIRDEATPRDFYCQIPNLVDIMELSPHAYRLYGHLRRVAGESGRCWKSTATLAKACDMSAGKVSESKQELETVYPPLIRIESKTFERGSYHEIAITDIWELNHRFFVGEQITVKTAKGQAFHNMNEWRSQYEKHPSQYETKNNPIKKNPSAEKVSKSLPANSDMGWMLAGGVSSEEIAASNEKDNAERDLLFFYEQEMGYGTTLDWWGKNADLVSLRKFIMTQTREDIETFAKWCSRKYSKFRPEDAARYPRNVIVFWPLAFKAEENEPEPYSPPIPKFVQPEEKEYVPNPNPRRHNALTDSQPTDASDL